MLRAFGQLAERHIAKTHAESVRKRVDGEGKPFPQRSTHQDTSQFAELRMMAEAGVADIESRYNNSGEALRRFLA